MIRSFLNKVLEVSEEADDNFLRRELENILFLVDRVFLMSPAATTHREHIVSSIEKKKYLPHLRT